MGHFVYKMTVDNGTAPCVQDNLLSLAICKPKIRLHAQVGDWLFSFGGKPLGGRLIYIAQVTERLESCLYYTTRSYSSRLDCIYRSSQGRTKLKARALVHREADHLKRDVGLNFERGHVLLSNNFRYLGAQGSIEYKKSFPKIAVLLEGLTQGHRSSFSPQLEAELFKLKKAIWKQYTRKVVGKPSHPLEQAYKHEKNVVKCKREPKPCRNIC